MNEIQEIGSICVKPIVTDDFIAQMSMGVFREQLDAAIETGIRSQIEKAVNNLCRAKNMERIQSLKCWELVDCEFISIAERSHRPIGIITTPNTEWKDGFWNRLAQKLYMIQSGNDQDRLDRRFYSVYRATSYPKAMPKRVLNSIKQVREMELFDSLYILARGSNYFQAVNGEGVVQSVESDPYVIGVVAGAEANQATRYFLVDAWDEVKLP